MDQGKKAAEARNPGILNRIASLKIDFNQIKFERKIGYGSFSEVFQASLGNSLIAVKKIPSDEITSTKIENLLKEIDLVSTCDHPNIIKVIGWCESPSILICLEYATLGSLQRFLSDSNIIKLGWSHSKTKIAMEAAAGLAYLHNRGIVHRDIKSENLLVFGQNNSFTIKVADFGSCRNINDYSKTISGSILWFAPELARGVSEYNFKTDIWAFGICLCEIISHSLPYEDLFSQDSFFNLVGVSQGKINPLEQITSASEIFKHQQETLGYQKVLQLIELCCQYQPENRPDFKNIIFFLMQIMIEDTNDRTGWQHQEDSILVQRRDMIRRASSLTLDRHRFSEESSFNSPTSSKIKRISDPTSSKKRSKKFQYVE